MATKSRSTSPVGFTAISFIILVMAASFSARYAASSPAEAAERAFIEFAEVEWCAVSWARDGLATTRARTMASFQNIAHSSTFLKLSDLSKASLPDPLLRICFNCCHFALKQLRVIATRRRRALRPRGKWHLWYISFRRTLANRGGRHTCLGKLAAESDNCSHTHDPTAMSTAARPFCGRTTIVCSAEDGASASVANVAPRCSCCPSPSIPHPPP